jgi:hypothetical protein
MDERNKETNDVSKTYWAESTREGPGVFACQRERPIISPFGKLRRRAARQMQMLLTKIFNVRRSCSAVQCGAAQILTELRDD